MSIVLVGSTSGSITLQEPAVAGTTVLDLPAVSGTFITTASSGQSIPKAALPTGSVLQVVSTTKTDTFSTASTTFTDVTGLSASITPTSSSSKIFVIVSMSCTGISGVFSAQARLMRGSTAIAVGDSAGSRTQASLMWEGGQEANFGISVTFLDSPATTSSTTYKMQLRTNSGANTTFVNRATSDVDSSAYARTVSTITVMEIAA
jgi:hypothetical protein